MSEGNSYRQILRSSSIIGGASAINIVIGLVKMKGAALLLGPAGVGLIGLFGNVVSVANSVAGLGFGTVGTRQIAEAAGDHNPVRVATARRALFWGTMVLALAGGFVLWLLRGVIANRVLDSPALAPQVGWLSIAVALTVAAASQSALLVGLRRIGDIARVQVGSAAFATALGLLALWQWGMAGIVVYVIAAPLGAFVLGHVFVARLPKVRAAPGDRAGLTAQWRTLARLGSAFMVAGLAGVTGQLAVRSLVQHDLGPAALGQFQASWAISMTYIGFVLGAMGTDYYPRLTAVIHDHAAASRLVNEQTEVALLLATPVLLIMLALAPWVIRALYSAQFAEATAVFRWQVLGDLLKLASWPLGFVLLAAGAGRAFVFTEWTGIGAFAFIAWLALPTWGVPATGVAFLGLYVVYLPLVYWLAVRRIQFKWNRGVVLQMLAGMLAACLVMGAGFWRDWLGATIGVPLAILFGLHGAARLGRMANLTGRLGQLATLSRTALERMGLTK